MLALAGAACSSIGGRADVRAEKVLSVAIPDCFDAIDAAAVLDKMAVKKSPVCCSFAEADTSFKASAMVGICWARNEKNQRSFLGMVSGSATSTIQAPLSVVTGAGQGAVTYMAPAAALR